MPDPAPLAAEDGLLAGISAGDARAFARWLALAEGRLRASLRPFASRVDVEAVVTYETGETGTFRRVLAIREVE